ncbi:hypothetical protein B1400_1706 [Bifidobacterium italicum]|uniref:Uncharacterized protein n=1 Tax=Bifidobacterium italicum TaxID=1960968 RepID=A0A2A2EDN2_9BIFI|nr:hypothetical protein [Bifidobacterium italicum]PAU67143.1 hypothetical protein B1400_1706 [Bifidobacterium italicum]
MAKNNGTIHDIIETNRRRPWRHFPNAHWSSLIMTCVLSTLMIIGAIRAHAPCIIAASLLVAGVIFLIVEAAFYAASTPPRAHDPSLQSDATEHHDTTRRP